MGFAWTPPSRLRHRLLAVALIATTHVWDALDALDAVDNLTAVL